MKKITIGIATHKKYIIPKDDIYLPIHSGAALSNFDLGYQRDDEGDNISYKNPNYSELTALYWLWKNDDSDYKGLVHYRRHFSIRKKVFWFEQGEFDEILDFNRISSLMEFSDIILPQKRHYYIETIESHYNHTHYEEDLIVTQDVIKKYYPEYLVSYNEVLKRKSAHMFNMFIMTKEKFDAYCEWLFPILFEIENRLNIEEYNGFHARVFGRISEILLDVWIQKNNYAYSEVPVTFMEKQEIMGKIMKFLKAKFRIKKY